MSTKPATGRVRTTYEFIKANRERHSVQEMCRVLGVAPSGYYEWLKQPLSKRAQEDARLLKLIRASFVASHGIYGAPRVFLDLREAGDTCSKHCVARLMREHQLRALHGYRTRRMASGKASVLIPNLLKRQFTVTQRNKAWVTDINLHSHLATIRRSVRLLAILILVSTSTKAQEFAHLGGPFSRQVVLNAPFSADATMTVRETSLDNTVRMRSVTARYFRDSRGQVRAELDTAWGPYVILAHAGPERMEFYMLDPVKRTYTNAALPLAERIFNGETGLALPIDKNCFEYPPLVAEGATDAERLMAVGADVSPELGMVRASRRFDDIPVSGSKGMRIQRSFDYAISHIRLDEPPPGLFEIPIDYTSVADTLVRFAPAQSAATCKPGTR